MGTYRFFIAVLITVTYAYVIFGAPAVINSGSAQYKLCTTDECTSAASEILANLNRTVDPCDDFYNFACGGWIRNNRANLSAPHVDSLLLIEKKTEKYLREILEKPSKPGDTVSLLKAKQVYAQCMNNKNGQVGEKGTFSKIINKYVEWPLLLSRSEWEKKNLTWQNVSTIFHKNGFDNGLYNLQVSLDKETFTNNVIFISTPSFYYERDDMIALKTLQLEQIKKGYINDINIVSNTETIVGTVENLTSVHISEREYEEEEDMFYIKMKESYIADIVRVASNLIEEIGGTVEIENLTQDALDIIHFEAELAALGYEEKNSLTIKELQQVSDFIVPKARQEIDWHSSIQEVFASEGITIEPSEKIVIQYIYLTDLLLLLKQTPSRTIVNYMAWTLIRMFPNYIKAPKVRNDIAHATNSTQHEEDDTTWKRCVEYSYFQFAISHEFVKTYILYKNKPHIKGISINIENEVREQIRKAAWMDETTKVASLEKLANMRHGFMNPEWYSNEAIDKYYEGLNVSTEYAESLINIFKFERKKMLSSLRTPVDKNRRRRLEPTTPDGYYSSDTNTLAITAALLQNPVYNRSHLPSLNYGSLGFIIAREINYIFDFYDRSYENSNEIEWWTQRTIDAYNNLTECFIDQYSNYCVPKIEDECINVEGRRTLEGNIADFAGIATTYYAYKNRKARLNEPELRLLGLEEYSEDQIFFMNFAQTWCEDILPEEVWKKLQDPHPLKEIRIRGSLSNLREFSDVYNCSVGKPMNPKKKCAFW